MGGLGGLSGAFGGEMPNLQQVAQQLQQNPDVMRQIMNSPMMQSLMSNPELLQFVTPLMSFH